MVKFKKITEKELIDEAIDRFTKVKIPIERSVIFENGEHQVLF